MSAHDLPHLRDVPASGLETRLRAAGAVRPDLAKRLRQAIHARGALTWDELPLGRREAPAVRSAFRFGPLLEPVSERAADDGTRKFAYRLRSGEVVELVFIRNRENRTLCLSSQAGCAMGCAFCATARLGLLRNLTAGEITEGRSRIERVTGERATDVVFMGMGEPLHNYDAVMGACESLNAQDANAIARKRITISTVGLPDAIRRYTRERRPWRLHLSLHSAIQEVRERLIPVARRHRLPDVLAALRDYQREAALSWVTLQYVALPGVNMDDAHVAALERELRGLRYIVNVIPWNDTGILQNDAGAAFRAPTWAEVKAFTTRLRSLRCPVKIRYSAGKREGMGCGQLAAESVAAESHATRADVGHMAAPPGIFTS